MRFAPSRRIVWVGLLATLALAAALRFVALGELPVNIQIDEMLPALEAQHIARGIQPNVFSSVGWSNTPNLAFAFGAVAMKAIGSEGLFAVRLSSAILGMGGILCVFLLARRWFGDRAALIAAFLMTVSYWHIYESRTAFSFVQSSFCTALVLYLLVRGLQDRSRLILAVAGVCTGLSLQCYFPARILLLLCPTCWVEEWVRNRQPLRAVLADGAAFCTGGVLVLLPLVISVPWPVLAGHSQGVLLTNPVSLNHLQAAYHVTGIWRTFVRNIQTALTMFTDGAQLAVRSTLPPAPLLDRATLIAFVIGGVAAIAQREPGALFLVWWAAFTLLCGVAFTDNPRASYRLAAAMPAIFMLAALGAERVLLSAGSRRWYRLTVPPVLITALALWTLTENYRIVFTDLDAREHWESVALRLLGTHCDGRRFYFVGDWRGQGAPGSQEPGNYCKLFCSNYAPLQADEIPIPDTRRPATFLLIPWADPRATETLRVCYPAATIVPHMSRAGRLLFTSIDASVQDLQQVSDGCTAAPVGSDAACGPR
jgi:4-amino-4-deoxy-L-arabinose transferase-like glycosyltransferase